MALDKVILNPGALGNEIGTDRIAGIDYEVVKTAFGDAGSLTLDSPTNPHPVTDAAAEAALASIAAEDFATQTTLAAVLAKLSSDPATQTTLAAILAKIIANPATDTLQTTGNTTLASILAKIIAAPSTEAKQDTIITALNNIDAGTAAALGQALMAASVPVVIASNQSAIPISGTVAVTGAGDATAANQATEIASLASIDAGIPAALGQTTMANSMPVTLASDQSSLIVSVGAIDNTTLYSNTLAVTGAITGILTTGYQSIIFSFSGVWVGLLLVEGSEDNSIWEQKIVLDVNEFAMQDIINENGIFQIKSSSKYIRINVQQVSGTITALIVGRTVPGLNAADSIAFAMDKSFNMPLYVEETATKKDISKALIPSDAPAPIYGFAQATNAIIFYVDTTGYQSVTIQGLTIGSNITIQHSNDGVTWASLSGYSSIGATGSPTVTSASIYSYPATGKFVRGLMTGASFTNCLVYLRQQPVSNSLASGGAPTNIQSIGGSTNAGLAGTMGVSGNIAPGVAPTANPIPLAIDTSGLTRRILTDTSGRLLGASLDQSNTTRPIGSLSPAAGIQNVASLATIELSQFEGQSQIELLAQVLLELRILNQNISELPIALQSQNGTLDEPLKFRNDPSVFAN